MGQTISRRLAGRLEKGMQRHGQLMKEDALQNIKEKQQRAAGNKYTDPNALEGGFQRGQFSENIKDMQQQAFLQQQENQQQQEMPQDLIKFLQDVGPLERHVDKNFTSPRLKQEKAPQDEQEDPNRQQRDMPLMQDSDFSTTRTTNFSKRLGEELQEENKGLTGQELYQLLMTNSASRESNNLESMLENKDEMTHTEKEDRMELMRQTLKHVAVPVLMKEGDENYIGTYADKVEELEKAPYKLKLVPKDRVQLYLEIEEQEEKAAGAAKDKTENPTNSQSKNDSSST